MTERKFYLRASLPSDATDPKLRLRDLDELIMVEVGPDQFLSLVQALRSNRISESEA